MEYNDSKICKLLDYVPNNWQAEVRESTARFKVICAGRRSGKTLLVSRDPKIGIVKYLFQNDKNVWIVAPSYDLTERVWEEVVKICRRQLAPLIEKINSSRGMQRIVTKLGTVIEAKSADDPRSLVGKGLDCLICDESALIDSVAWNESLRPSLIDRKGEGIFIGTPKQKNWFYNLWLKGNDPTQLEYKSWRFSSFDNNYLDKAELDKIVSEMPEIEYQQEILADFLEGFGQLFRKVRQNFRDTLKPPESGHRYVMGVDLGKVRDFTVFCVFDRETNDLVFFDRFKEIDWTLQKTRIEALARRYNRALVVIDSTGVGDPVVEDLKKVGLPIQEVKITSVNKHDFIRKLMLFIEQQRIHYPDIPELTGELESFGAWDAIKGETKYCAAPGNHDDCVISMGLAVWVLKEILPGRTYSALDLTDNSYETEWHTAYGE